MEGMFDNAKSFNMHENAPWYVEDESDN